MFTATEAYDRHVGRYSRQLGRKLIGGGRCPARPDRAWTSAAGPAR